MKRVARTPDVDRPILVALGPEAQALRLIHRAFWLAREQGRPWVALHISVPEAEDGEEADQARLWLLEAERLGAETRWIEARTVAAALQEAVRGCDAGDLFVGRTEGHWPWVRVGPSLAQELERRALPCRLHVVALPAEVRHPLRLPPRDTWFGAALACLLILGACTGVGWILPPEQPLPAIFLLYLLGTAFIAERYGLAFGAGSVACAALCFDLVFDSHPKSLQVGDWPTLALFLAVMALGQYGVALTERMRDQGRVLRRREAMGAGLHLFSSRLASVRTRDDLEAVLAQVAPRLLRRSVALSPTDLPPLQVQGPPLDPPGEDLLQAMGAQVALTLERLDAQATLERSRLAQETDRMRASLLEAIGHDLRTPLAAIQGAASSLLLDPDVPHRRDLLSMVCSEAQRLGTLLNNLLDLTRLESLDAIPLQDWIALEEVAASALHRSGVEAEHITLQVAEGLPLVRGDGALLEQLVVNLLTNAARHAPGSPVAVALRPMDPGVRLEVSDRGPGIPDTLKQRVFDKFFRLPGRATDGGVGLGLAICEAIVRLHGGALWVEDAPGGGATFCVSLPAPPVPALPEEELP